MSFCTWDVLSISFVDRGPGGVREAMITTIDAISREIHAPTPPGRRNEF
ncbi:MAG: hypothetical protein ACI8TX_003979 [Hyphomicrobiaceae bacterium]